jgi:hypothetical protein
MPGINPRHTLKPCSFDCLLGLDDRSIDGAIRRVSATVSDGTQRIFRRQLFVDVDAETRFAAAV